LARKLGARRWWQRRYDSARSRDRVVFSFGSSGPFGEELPGRWNIFEKLLALFDKAEASRQAGTAVYFGLKPIPASVMPGLQTSMALKMKSLSVG
jgi:hypothetical protein